MSAIGICRVSIQEANSYRREAEQKVTNCSLGGSSGAKMIIINGSGGDLKFAYIKG